MLYYQIIYNQHGQIICVFSRLGPFEINFDYDWMIPQNLILFTRHVVNFISHAVFFLFCFFVFFWYRRHLFINENTESNNDFLVVHFHILRHEAYYTGSHAVMKLIVLLHKKNGIIGSKITTIHVSLLRHVHSFSYFWLPK